MHMDQKIFTLGLPTETVSCYLLLTGLADQGQPLLREEVEKLWSGTPDGLSMALDDLSARGIIECPQAKDAPLRLLPSEMWRN